MPEVLYGAALLACPVGMGIMMWLMMRGGNHASDRGTSRQELEDLRAEVDQLRAGQRSDSPTPDGR